MTTEEIVAELDRQIGRLQQVRGLLGEADRGVAAVLSGKRGRPKGSGKTAAGLALASLTSSTPQWTMSPEGRERIAAAQRTRWAKQKGTGAPRKITAGNVAKKAAGKAVAKAPGKTAARKAIAVKSIAAEEITA